MFKRISVFFLVLLGACSSVEDVPLPITSSSPEALALYEKGRLLKSQWNGQEADSVYKEALALDPDFIRANLEAENNFSELGQLNRKNAIKNKANGSDAEEIIVDIYIAFEESRSNDALKLAEKLVDKYPNSSEAYRRLGFVKTEISDFDGAIAAFLKATELNPKDADSWYGLLSHQVQISGDKLAPDRLRNKKTAIKYADALIKAVPDGRGGYHLRGNIERADGNFEQAKEYYQEALDISKRTKSEGVFRILNVAGHNYMFSGDNEKAISNYDQIIDNSKNSWFRFTISGYKANLSLFNGDFYDAISVYEDTEKRMDGWGFSTSDLLSAKGRINFWKFFTYAHMQEKETAWQALKRSQKYYNNYMDTIDANMNFRKNSKAGMHKNNAWYYLLFGEYEHAEQELKLVYEIQSKDQSPTALDEYNGLYGMVHLMKGDPKSALKFFNENINVENYTYYAYFKGLALKGTDNKTRADDIFNKIANHNFSSWDAALVRSLAQKQLKQ